MPAGDLPRSCSGAVKETLRKELWGLLGNGANLPGNCFGTAWELPGNCLGTARGLLRNCLGIGN
eukprot:6093430-Lingulodinium_polyedra.AAC.1